VNIGVHEGEEEFFGDVHQAHAVGSPEADACFPGNGKAAVLQRAALRARFGKPRAFDDHAPNAFSSAGGKRLGHRGGGHNDNGQIHRAGNFFHRRITGQGLDIRVIGIDGIKAAGVAVAQIGQNLAAQTAFAGGGADDGNGCRIEKSFHGRSLRKKVMCCLWPS